eukprot:3384461-Ditylum_brightwellii.AAC.2
MDKDFEQETKDWIDELSEYLCTHVMMDEMIALLEDESITRKYRVISLENLQDAVSSNTNNLNRNNKVEISNDNKKEDKTEQHPENNVETCWKTSPRVLYHKNSILDSPIESTLTMPAKFNSIFR